jgi:serine/threonine-protein kinase RsbW
MLKSFEIASEINNLRVVERAIDEISAELGVNAENYGKILVCTMEAVNNAIIHGNKADKKKSVKIEILQGEEGLEICIEDQGPGFKPGDIPDPTSSENIENLSGRGVFLMSKLADKIEFNERGNRVTMTFKYVPA